MLQKLSSFVHSLWYWLAVIATALVLEGVALFYQYGLGEPPCVLCIQSRFWVLVGIIFAVAGALHDIRLRFLRGARRPARRGGDLQSQPDE